MSIGDNGENFHLADDPDSSRNDTRFILKESEAGVETGETVPASRDCAGVIYRCKSKCGGLALTRAQPRLTVSPPMASWVVRQGLSLQKAVSPTQRRRPFNRF